MSTPDWLETILGNTVSDAQLASVSTIGGLGVVGAARTSDYRAWSGGATGGAQGVNGYAINDDTGSGVPIAAGMTALAIQKTSVTGISEGEEIGIANASGVTTDTPYGGIQGGTTLGLNINCGFVGYTNNCSAGLVIALSNTGSKLEKGIIVQDTLDPTVGAGGDGVAMEMAAGQSLRWLNSGNATDSEIYGNANGFNVSENANVTGMLGIGTTTPWGALSVQTSNNSSAPEFVVGSSTATSVFVSNNGNVGIGTASPQYRLDVLTPTNSGILVREGNSAYGSTGIYLGASATGNTAVKDAIMYNYPSGNGYGTGDLIFAINNSQDLSNVSTANTDMIIKSSGNVGIGTTNPYSRLQVSGPDTASTSAFAVVNSASTTEFTVYDTGNATLAGSLVQNSDVRLKTNINDLDGSSSLAAINALNPVTFNWIDPEKSSVPQFGFVAQQVQSVFPNLVSTTSPTTLTPDGTLSLNYIDLISPIVAAIQELDREITSLASTVAGFAQSITTQVLTAMTGNFNQVCLADGAGKTCITRSQLDAVLASANQSASASGSPSSSPPDATDTPDSKSSPQAPVIQINGDSPAIVHVGASYSDLGATITGPQADLNLGIKTFLNGALVSNIVLDTSAAATDTINYVVTDSRNLTSTSTRTIIVEPAAIPPPPASSADASSTAATSTTAS